MIIFTILNICIYIVGCWTIAHQLAKLVFRQMKKGVRYGNI